jgi:hypothetical protein
MTKSRGPMGKTLFPTLNAKVRGVEQQNVQPRRASIAYAMSGGPLRGELTSVVGESTARTSKGATHRRRAARIAKYLAFSEQYSPIQQNILNRDPTPSGRSLKSVEPTFHWCKCVLTSFSFWRKVRPPCADRHPCHSPRQRGAH